MLVNDCDSKYQREHRVWGYLGLTFSKAHPWGPALGAHPPSCTEAHRDPGHQPVLLRCLRQLPSYSKPDCAEWNPEPSGKGLNIQPRRLFGSCFLTAPVRKPCAIQGPGSPHSMQQHLGYTQAAGVRYYGAGAQQPKCLANKLPFIKCRISKLGCLWQWKCQKGMRYSYNEQVSAQPAENKVRTVPAPPSLETSVHDLFFSHVFSSVTPVSISSCRTNTHTEYATQQLYKLNWAL